MTNLELYTRLLEEMSYVHRSRDTFMTRLKLMDVLIELRARAAAERGDRIGQETQDLAESVARRRINGV